MIKFNFQPQRSDILKKCRCSAAFIIYLIRLLLIFRRSAAIYDLFISNHQIEKLKLVWQN
jgi:hypothetical protein